MCLVDLLHLKNLSTPQYLVMCDQAMTTLLSLVCVDCPLTIMLRQAPYSHVHAVYLLPLMINSAPKWFIFIF